MTHTCHIPAVLLFTALSAVQVTAWAQESHSDHALMPRPTIPAGSPRADTDAAPPQSGRSVSEAVRWVRRTNRNVQILGVEQVPFEGRYITRVKFVDDQGRVRTVDDPGPSGDGSTRTRNESREDTNDT